MNRFFKLTERNTSVRTELIAGMTTFFSMVYILMVNANMFADPFGDGSNPLGVSYGAIYIATAISAVTPNSFSILSLMSAPKIIFADSPANSCTKVAASFASIKLMSPEILIKNIIKNQQIFIHFQLQYMKL